MGTEPAENCVELATAELREAADVLHKAIAELPQHSSTPDSPTEDALKTMYQEVCKHHQSISEFRGKLLGLVPIASGAFIGIITASVDWSDGYTGPLLIAAGVVGALVTFGLYLFEAWQSDTCRHLIHHASFLEKELRVEAGQFRTNRPKARVRDLFGTKALERREQHLSCFEQVGAPPEQYLTELKPKVTPHGTEHPEPRLSVGAETAGRLVYLTVIVGWLFVACIGVVALF